MNRKQRDKLAAQLDEMARQFGLTKNLSGDYAGVSKRFSCAFRATLMAGREPWLACRFDRQPLYEPWRPGDARNKLFADAHEALGANPYSGKFNCHNSDAESFRCHLMAALEELNR